MSVTGKSCSLGAVDRSAVPLSDRGRASGVRDPNSLGSDNERGIAQSNAWNDILGSQLSGPRAAENLAVHLGVKIGVSPGDCTTAVARVRNQAEGLSGAHEETERCGDCTIGTVVRDSVPASSSSGKNARRRGCPHLRTVTLPGTPGDASGVCTENEKDLKTSSAGLAAPSKIKGSSEHEGLTPPTIDAVHSSCAAGAAVSGKVKDAGAGSAACGRSSVSGKNSSSASGKNSRSCAPAPPHLRTVALPGTPGDGSGVEASNGCCSAPSAAKSSKHSSGCSLVQNSRRPGFSSSQGWAQGTFNGMWLTGAALWACTGI